MYLILLSWQQASLEIQWTNQDGTLDTPTVDGQWTNMNVQWAILDTWWKIWMGMSGQLCVDSGNQVNTLSCNHLGSCVLKTSMVECRYMYSQMTS